MIVNKFRSSIQTRIVINRTYTYQNMSHTPRGLPNAMGGQAWTKVLVALVEDWYLCLLLGLLALSKGKSTHGMLP